MLKQRHTEQMQYNMIERPESEYVSVLVTYKYENNNVISKGEAEEDGGGAVQCIVTLLSVVFQQREKERENRGP